MVSSAPATAVGELAAHVLDEAVAARGLARLAIPGGSALAAMTPARELVGERWEGVQLTWTDERRVPEADPDSNRGAARRAGLLDPAPALELPLHLDGETPEESLARVRAVWHGELQGALDLVLLGMGADGHVASLFPGRDWHGNVALHVTGSPKPPPERISLTRDALATARTTLLYATGEAKRDALKRLVKGDPALPATGLPGLVIVTDLELVG
jgi:6-phosphogluconolactonase